MSDTTNSNDQTTQPQSKREKALKAVEGIRELCRDIYNTAFNDREPPDEIYEIYTRAQRLDGHIENAWPDPAPTTTTGV